MRVADQMYVPALQEAAEFLAQPQYNFVVPFVYLALTLLGYMAMRGVKVPFTPPKAFTVVYNLGIQVSEANGARASEMGKRMWIWARAGGWARQAQSGSPLRA